MQVTIAHGVTVDIDSLSPAQAARFWHHVELSRRVFEASVQGMLKGVLKYGPEPTLESGWGNPSRVELHWLPHIFSEAVDAANQTALFADALGVEL